MNKHASLVCVLCLMGLVHSVPVPRFQHFMVKDNLWETFMKNFLTSAEEESDLGAALLSTVNTQKINVDKKENIWVGSLPKSPETTNPNYPQKNSWTLEHSLIDPEGGPAGRLVRGDTHNNIIPTHTHTRPRKIGQFSTIKRRMQDADAKSKLANFRGFNKIAATGPDTHFRTNFPKRSSKTAASLPMLVRKYSKNDESTPKHSRDKTTVGPDFSRESSLSTLPVHVPGLNLPADQELVKEQDRRMISGFVSDDRESARQDNKERFRRRLELLLANYPENQRRSKRQQLVQQLLTLSSRLQDQIKNNRERDRRARIL